LFETFSNKTGLESTQKEVSNEKQDAKSESDKVIFRLKNDMRMGFYLEKTAKNGSRFKGEP